MDEALAQARRRITVDGYRAKDGSNTANAARVTLADGSKVFAGSSGTPPERPPRRPGAVRAR